MRPIRTRFLHGCTVAVLATGGITANPAATTAQEGTSGEWPHYAGDAGSTRYSALDLIDAENAAELEVAWRWTTLNYGPNPEPYMRVTPIYVDGVLYTTAGNRRAVAAIDPATGETLWTYRLDEGERAASAPRRNSGRGVSYWTDGSEARVILITPAYFLVSLDARTGIPDPAFGEDGVVDLRADLGREIDRMNAEIGSSSPAMVVGDVLVVGAALPQGNRPPSPEMPPGHVRGYDARTGALLWTFHTIPQPGEPFHDTWEDGSWEYTGNTAVWTPMSADLERGLVYLPVEAGTGDYYGGHRPGDNIYSQSLVALDARTGEPVWHFQTVHHGIWDYDPPAAPILLDLVVDGRAIEAVALVTKQGFTYVFDRATGEPVWPIEERPVPQSDVPGEKTAPTQPFPTLPEPFDRQGVSEDDLIDLTPELRELALEAARSMTLGPLFTPPTVIVEDGNQGTLMLGGSLGGANWPGAAWDPETRRLFVPSATSPSLVGLSADPDASEMSFIQGRSRVSTLIGQPGLPMVKPPWGRITALDMDTGRVLWMIANDDTPKYIRDHPMLEGVEVPRTGRATRAGLLATKTLLFAGTGQGGGGAPDEGVLRAHDKGTGEIVAEIALPAHQTGVPMTYLHDGEQYIVVAVAGRGVPGELVALRLPRSP
ncbi:MAG: pyrroloquinoline quinone-dependent dehydrogenase [Gemmatimonadota bacterium]|nr:pyrroloquinoline quinone-dependent dehydrogenase [Gemmatimonadota bacterium]